MDKVDEKLFVTCRLCIEEDGRYPIVPTIQEQFKYCFNINVEPFDGLPPLICQTCKDILNDFYNKKKLYCDKQDDLINKCKKGIYTKCMPQHDIVSSSQRTEDLESRKRSSSKTNKTNYSSESNDSGIKFNRKIKKKKVKHREKWDYAGFKKEYICIVCDSEWPTKQACRGHQALHSSLIAEHFSIFKRNCSVVLERVDGRPNITGLINIVVHSNNKIIERCNSLCYIKYSKESNQSNCNNELEKTVTENEVGPVTSDTEDELIARHKHTKRRRLLSRSSTDTVIPVINGDISDNEKVCKPVMKNMVDALHQQLNDDQCISIDDSSDSDSDRHQIELTNKKQQVEAKLDDYKTIQNIISMCVKNYNKKMDSVDRTDKGVYTESQLKPKILSIGRKIMNKPGLNWKGLIKYMEHKNLSIIWAPKAMSSNNGKDSNYIRFMTKLRSTDTSSDNSGWTPIEVPEEVLASDINLPLNTKEVTSPIIDNDQFNSDSAVLVINNETENLRKLLNANPVANPKQLPKKLGQGNEPKLVKPPVELVPTFQNNEDVNLCLPIITSTTSLALPKFKEQQQKANTPPITNTTSGPVGWLKVKPASELMSQKTLNSLRNDQSMGDPPSNMLQKHPENAKNLLHSQPRQTGDLLLTPITNNSTIPWGDTSNIYPPLVPLIHVPVVTQPMQLVQLLPQSSANYQTIAVPPSTTTQNTTNKEEYLILDSVELPNTRTNSPFQYLSSLLWIHDLHLLLQADAVTRDFVCLIKFKVKFQQEPIDEPVVLCLSLFCSQNKFCITVKDRNQVVIGISKITSNWQWEIINVFKGDPVEKMLQQNAQKHSKETHGNTQKFLCLLKSITSKKENEVNI